MDGLQSAIQRFPVFSTPSKAGDKMEQGSVEQIQRKEFKSGTRQKEQDKRINGLVPYVKMSWLLTSTNSREKQPSSHGAMRPSPRSHSWPSAGLHSINVVMLLWFTNAFWPCWWLQQNVHHQNSPLSACGKCSKCSKFSHLWYLWSLVATPFETFLKVLIWENANQELLNFSLTTWDNASRMLKLT